MKTVSLIVKEPETCRLARVSLKNSKEFALNRFYETAEEGLRDIPGHRPDILLVSVRLPGMSGIEFAHILKRGLLKRALPNIPLIMLADQLDFKVFLRIFKVGAQGCLGMPVTAESLQESIRKALAGRRTYSDDWQDFLVNRLIHSSLLPCPNGLLTPGEEIIMEFMIDGKDDKEIALETKKATATVRSMVQHIHTKLDVHHRWEAVAAYLGFDMGTKE